MTHPTNLISMGSFKQCYRWGLIRVMVCYLLAVLIAIPLGILMGYYSFAIIFLITFGPFRYSSLGLGSTGYGLVWSGEFATLFGVGKDSSYLAEQFKAFHGLYHIYRRIFSGGLVQFMGSEVLPRPDRRDIGTRADSRQIFTRFSSRRGLSIVNGMRTGLGVAWMCLVAAEMLPGSISGVGYLITHAYTVAQTDIVIAGMISIGAGGALLDGLFR